MKKQTTLMAGLLALSVSSYLPAAEIGEVQWHGFLTSAFLMTSGAGEGVEYAEGVSDEGGVKDTRFGLNLTTQVDTKWQLAAQIEALGEEDFEAEIDWAFVKHSLSDYSHVRFGKVKHPAGLVNDYADIGYTYLWIRPPDVFYNKATIGSNISYFSYTGASVTLGGEAANGLTYDLDLHYGSVGMEDGSINGWYGVKFSMNLQDEIRFQVGMNSGEMEIEDTNSWRLGMMNEKEISSVYLGFAMETDSLIIYAEAAQTDHEENAMMDMDANAAYVSLGIPLGDYTTSLTYETWEAKHGWGQKSVGLGLRKNLSDNSMLKVEYKKITPETTANGDGGKGLFEGVPEKDSVSLFGVALDVVF